MRDVFTISEEDIQLIAKDIIGRKLAPKEIKIVQVKLDDAFRDWAYIVSDAIEKFN